MWNLFYRNVHLLILTLCLIVVCGLSAYFTMPRLEDPVLTQRSAAIVTLFPGASADRIETLVTKKVEQELFEIEAIDTINSTSRTGISTVIVDLKDSIEDVNAVWAQVRSQLLDLSPQLPDETSEPEYRELEGKASSLIVALTWDLETPTSYAILRRKTEELAAQLRLIQGTEKVELVGDPDEEILVEVRPTELSALGLTPQEVAQQIQSSDAKIAAGRLRNPSNELLIEPETELNSLDRIRQIPVRSGRSGQVARIGDIAQVKKGIIEPPSDLAIINGRPAVALAALVDPSQHLGRWATAAHQTLQDFQSQLPTGIGLQVVFDQNQYVEARINGLFTNLLLGALLVVGSTLFMMGWKAALIVGLSLPLSVLMVFGAMNILGIPLHQMSVTGLVMALGLLIDNAIVAVDELHHYLAQGVKPTSAIQKSVRFLAIPLLASTLTTIFTFMPNALMTGTVGEFIRTVGISIILALISSLFLSLTVIPALYGRFYTANDPASQKRSWFRHLWHTGFYHARLAQLYQSVLANSFSRPTGVILLLLTIPLSGFLMATNLDQQLFPSAERDQFHIELELQPQASLEQNRMLVKRARELLIQYPEVKRVDWFLGENAPAFYYNAPKVRENSANYAQAIVQLSRIENSPDLFQRLQNELSQAFPAAQVLARPLEQGPVVGAPIQIRLYGPSLDVLRVMGNQLRATLTQLPNVVNTRATLANVLPKLGLRLDEEQARLAGLNNALIAQQLDTAVEGSVGGSILEGTEELPVRVRLSNAQRGDLDQITSLRLLPEGTPSGENISAIPFSALSTVDLVPELAVIPRRNGQRVNTVEAFVAPGVLPSTVLKHLKQALKTSDFQLPPGHVLEFGGESEERSQALTGLFSKIPIFLVLMIASLVLTFQSFKLASIIIGVAICSIGLGFVPLRIFGYPLGFMAILGIAGLVGVAINDSIVVLAALRADPMARRGDRLAIRQVVTRATRHVLTTTLTTIVGLMPLLLSGGGFWPPLAIAMIGGIGGATLLALFFVPSVYLLMTVGRPSEHVYR